MAKISVIVPCYNVEKYIDRCMGTLINQTIGSSNMEIILVNDASTDGTLAKLKEWEKRYPETVLVITYEENLRQGGARNIGMQYATGEYIGFVDADDWVELNMFEILYDEISSNERDIVYCKFYRDNGQECKEHRLDGTVSYLRVDSEEKRREFICSNCLGYGVWDKLYRRDFLMKNNIFFPEHVAYEDIFFSGLYYMYAEKIAIVNYELYHYFVNEQSTVLKKNAEYHDDILFVTKARVEEYRKRGMLEKYHDEIELDIIVAGYLAALKVMFLRYDKVPYQLFCEFKEYMNREFPDVQNNPFAQYYIPEKYRILLGLLAVPVTQEQIEEIAESFRKIDGVN